MEEVALNQLNPFSAKALRVSYSISGKGQKTGKRPEWLSVYTNKWHWRQEGTSDFETYPGKIFTEQGKE